MAKQEYKVLGVMSGTSLDGVDIALVTLTKTNVWSFKINTATTIPYPDNWQTKLKEAISYKAKDMETLNTSYTVYLSKIINEFIAKNTLEGRSQSHYPETVRRYY